MSDRWVFLVSVLTVVFIVAGAFAVVPLFWYELMKSLIFLTVALLVFFGENRFSFMLGFVAPVVWLLADLLLGGLVQDMQVLMGALMGNGVPPLDTPLHGVAILLEIILALLALMAWRKQVTERLFGKTFGLALAVSVVYTGLLVGYYLHSMGSATVVVGHTP